MVSTVLSENQLAENWGEKGEKGRRRRGGGDGGFWNFSPWQILWQSFWMFCLISSTPPRGCTILTFISQMMIVRPEKLSNFLKVTQFTKAKPELIWQASLITSLRPQSHEMRSNRSARKMDWKQEDEGEMRNQNPVGTSVHSGWLGTVGVWNVCWL